MLGVTMEESGITKVIAIKLENEGDHVVTENLPDIENFEEEEVPLEENVIVPPHPLRRVQTGNDNP